MKPDVKQFLDWLHPPVMGFSYSSLVEMTTLAKREETYIGNFGWQHPTVKRREK